MLGTPLRADGLLMGALLGVLPAALLPVLLEPGHLPMQLVALPLEPLRLLAETEGQLA